MVFPEDIRVPRQGMQGRTRIQLVDHVVVALFAENAGQDGLVLLG
jgi:hypothetical protein